MQLTTVNEKLLDKFIRHSIYLERFKNSEAKKISAFLGKEVYPAAMQKVTDAIARGANPQRMREVAASIDIIMRAGSVKAGQATISSLTDLSRYEAQWTADTIEKAVPLDIELKMPSQEVLKQIVTTKSMDGHKLQSWLQMHSAVAKTKMMKSINTGIVLGEGIPAIGHRMRQVLALKQKQAEAIARTAISSVVHNAREEVYKLNSDIVKKYEWISTLDMRTTLTCINLDGQVFIVGQGPRPPIHFQCRSTTIPVIAAWNELGIEAPPPGTRASMNGAVPDKITYKDWFKKQTADTQLKVLGPGRYKLYKAGTPIKDFVSTDYSPISMVRLKTMEPTTVNILTSKLEVVTNRVYHGTSKVAAEKIISEGFKSGQFGGMSSTPVKEFVFVTSRKSGAEWYAKNNFRIKGKSAVVSADLKGNIYKVEGSVNDYGAMARFAKDVGLMQENESLLNLPLIVKELKARGFSGISYHDNVSNRLVYAVLPDKLRITKETI